MIYPKPKTLSSLALLMTCVSLAALTGCNGDQASGGESKVPAAQAENHEPTYDELNTTLIAKFPSPGRAQEASSLDILQPETAFRLYNNLRTWQEDGRDIANLLETSLGEGGDGVHIFKLGREYSETSDEFKRHDLEGKILAETQQEAAKVDGNRSVKFLSEPGKQVSLALGKYNFDEMTFKIDSCLFSDKLKYSKEEARNAQHIRGADQERCYFRTSNTALRVGFVGGSKVKFKVESSDLARKIEADRNVLRIAVYGYVESVQRDKVGGNLAKERLVLIAPQRVVLLYANGQVLTETTI
ncbi:hypothetical protein [Pseudomonas kurunegalensis]|uniref:Uncharacterized protein n=1 Tax=Pseudomonas kurunegalensis TaxID=485880 RepID=A0ACC5UH91_9PSED|nr:hypothetical protein [Pseudomonas kurunegalensis]MBV4513799.1 hypothetical protein [Pseudomonas kurunegalensis]